MCWVAAGFVEVSLRVLALRGDARIRTTRWPWMDKVTLWLTGRCDPDGMYARKS